MGRAVPWSGSFLNGTGGPRSRQVVSWFVSVDENISSVFEELLVLVVVVAIREVAPLLERDLLDAGARRVSIQPSQLEALSAGCEMGKGGKSSFLRGLWRAEKAVDAE